MKILKLIVHKSCQQDLSDKLRAIDFVDNFTFAHIEGHSNQEESNAQLTTQDLVVGYVTKIRVDVLIEESKLQNLLKIIRTIKGVTDQGVYWVVPVEQFGEI